jgi:hypothetical protein
MFREHGLRKHRPWSVEILEYWSIVKSKRLLSFFGYHYSSTPLLHYSFILFLASPSCTSKTAFVCVCLLSLLRSYFHLYDFAAEYLQGFSH